MGEEESDPTATRRPRPPRLRVLPSPGPCVQDAAPSDWGWGSTSVKGRTSRRTLKQTTAQTPTRGRAECRPGLLPPGARAGGPASGRGAQGSWPGGPARGTAQTSPICLEVRQAGTGLREAAGRPCGQSASAPKHSVSTPKGRHLRSLP